MTAVSVQCISLTLLVWALTTTICRCCDSKARTTRPQYPTFRKKDKHSQDLLLHPTSDGISMESLHEMRRASRTCLPCPGRSLEAYSGFIPVDNLQDGSFSSYLFFLHIKSEKNSDKKPLLLWLQGGPGKSALHGQFLENGPLGMTFLGTLYKRRHTLLKQFNIIYLDQPVGAGYSFDKRHKYPSSLQEVSTHLMTFMRRFLRLFHEYKRRDFFIAGESYGARSAVGMANRLVTQTPEGFPLRFKGVMLGVPFLFPLLHITNSADFLYCSGLLDEDGRELFSGRFSMIQKLVSSKQYLNAAGLLSRTVFNLGLQGEQSLFSNLTGFFDHASIVSFRKRREDVAYNVYANRWDFKQRIHVDNSRILDGTRQELAKQLALNDLFVDQRDMFAGVLNRTSVLIYTGQLDALFPAVKMYESFKMLRWRGSELFKEARRTPWYRNDKPSLGLLGYLKKVDSLMYATVLFGGHHISQDCTPAVNELYERFLKFVKSRDEPRPTSQQKGLVKL